MCDQGISDIPFPSGWAKNVKSAVLHVISLAHYAITCARGWAANSINARVRLTADNDRLNQEVQLLGEEIRIKDARMAKLDPRRRPYYAPTERMAILEFKAARGWSLAQTAKAFLVQPATIASWLKRTDEEGDTALVQLREPVTKFPDSIRYIVQHLKAWCKRKGIRPRFGAVGKYGSIAVVERFIRTLKDECTRRIVVPLRRCDMRRELTCQLLPLPRNLSTARTAHSRRPIGFNSLSDRVYKVLGPAQ
jgi:hypothetical protein